MPTTVIIDAPRFDITVTESNDYRRVPRYLIRYGLDAKNRDTLAEALREFQHCLAHATALENFTDQD